MQLEFAKLNGAGNDFIMVDDLKDEITLSPEQVIEICDRHFGVGGDGVILVKPSPREECAAYMDYYNSDGTKAQMCGNGVRCFAKFLVDRKIVDPAAGSFVADTLAGPRPISFTLDDEGLLKAATVNMGEPILVPTDVPCTLAANSDAGAAVDQLVTVRAGAYRFTAVSMGNPHAVTFVDDPLSFPLEVVGTQVECAAEFPEKTNVEFASVDASTNTITMRVWERGCGETLACGTGACATAVAAILNKKIDAREADLKLLGGTLHIKWDESDNHVYMKGPAAQYFTGVLTVSDVR